MHFVVQITTLKWQWVVYECFLIGWLGEYHGVMCRRGHCYLLDESSFHVFCGLWSSFHGNLARCRHRLHAWDEWVLLLTGETAFSAHRRNCFIRLLCLVGSCPVIPIWKIFWVDWFCSIMSWCSIGWDNGTRLQVSQLWLYCCWAICLTDDVVLHYIPMVILSAQ